MAHKIANELLQMILDPLMHVSDERFSSDSNTAFGCNVKFPTSSLLLVCKRWLQVATPLLYRVVVLRSTAQAQSLAEVFSQHRQFPLYVRKIRLEGAYSCLWHVIRPCSNLHTICFTLDIYAVAVVTGLCRSLYSVNPTRVILRDRCDTKNVKIEQVFCKLLECIPHWTNLSEFHYPYARTESFFRGSKPERLAIALSQSTTLRTISAELPLSWNADWSTMTTNPNISFRFKETRVQSQSDVQRLLPVIGTMLSNPEVREKVDPFSLRQVVSNMHASINHTYTSILPKPSFTPFAGISASTTDMLWTRIFAFATSPGHPDFFDVSDLTGSRTALYAVNFTRKSLTLVSKLFHRLSQQFLYQVPLLAKDRSLTRLMLRCNQDPTILHQVRVLSLYMLGHHLSTDVNFELTALIPHLIGLEHYVGCLSLSISSRVFALLAESAGPTLLTIHHLSITANNPVPESIFWNFRRLTRLDFDQSPQVIFPPPMSPPWDLPTFSRKLVSATIPQDQFMRKCLKICGPTLLNLQITPGSTKYIGILQKCPRLKVLTWTGNWGRLSELLQHPYCHRRLTKLNVRVPHLNKSAVAGLRKLIPALSDALTHRRLPSLREINMAGYTWPIEERDIEKDMIVDEAIFIKKTFPGVNITDDIGEPWRLRAEKRR